MTHPDVPAEQAHVDHAYARLEAMRQAAAGRLQEAFGERGGTFQAVTERDIRVRNSLNRLEQLQIGREALVFGRIDRLGDGTGGPEAFHIGRLAVSDEDLEPLVVDWRAPVAEPFYRATGAVPMGLRRRRHFLVEGSHIQDLQDELLTGGEGAEVGLGLSGSEVLLATLERSRTGHMRDIVATVQREQDEIIRGPLSGVLVVQGGPGTGKTAVALHRAAYLLYTHRFPLESQGVLVVGPNPTFLHYIEQVLPSLGESGVELSTVSALFGDVKVTGHDGPAVARLKGEPRMATVVANAVRGRQRPLRRPLDIPYGRAVLRLTTAASAQIVASAQRRPGPHNARRRVVEQLLWRHLQGEVDRRRGVTDRDADTTQQDAAELGRELRRRPDVAEALDRMWPVLTPPSFLHDLFGAAPLIDLAARNLVDEAGRAALYRARSSSLDEVAWTREDVPLLDEARALLGSAARRSEPGDPDEIRTFGHIVVDEAQDLSPMQLRMLARRSLSGSMTVVGDIAQATGPWAPAGWDRVTAHLPQTRPPRQVELTVNYRTPAEIMDVAARVLTAAAPGMVPPEAVRSSGEPPSVVAAADRLSVPATVVQTLAGPLGGDGQGTLAVIAPPSLLTPIGDELTMSGVPFSRAGEDALDAAVSVLEVDNAKGLEFDGVLVVEPAALVREATQGLRALYVAMTRATKRLTLVHAEPLPAPLAELAEA